ncbi:MAG TPA: hypothetical protein VEB21_18090 [Terriglobales bacterium]|nr:hypothetical protein [Terriglobales bacterium]
MAEIIPFEDVVRSRRRRRERENLQRCLELLRLNLDYCELLQLDCDEPERTIHRRRTEQLAALIDYAERIA